MYKPIVRRIKHISVVLLLCLTARAAEKKRDYTKLWTEAGTVDGNFLTFARMHEDQFSWPSVDNSVASRGKLRCILDKPVNLAKDPDCFDNWPLAQQALAWMLQLGFSIRTGRSSGVEMLEGYANISEVKEVWFEIKDIYCQERPGDFYINLDNNIATCRR